MKRLALLLPVLLALCLPAHAATPTFVQATMNASTNGVGSQTVTTYQVFLPNPSGAGNALICGLREDHAASDPTFSLSDGGDSFTVAVTNDNNAAGGSSNIGMAWAVNIAAGRTQITLTLSASNTGVQMHCEEWQNIATSSPVDGATCANANTSTSLTCGSAIGASGDLVVSFAVTDTGNFIASPPFWTAGSSYTMHSTDVEAGASMQEQVVGAANQPAETLSLSESWDMVGVAFKSASSGTAPGNTIRVQSVQHNEVLAVSPDKVQAAIYGNLAVVSFIGTDPFRITAISDNRGDTWTQVPAGTGFGNSGGAHFCKGSTGSSGDGTFWYDSSPASGAHTLSITLSGASGNSTLFIYDIVHAATTNVLDTELCTVGNDTTTGGSVSGGSFTIASANELVIDNTGVATCEVTGQTASSGGTAVSDFTITSPIFGTGSLDENNGWLHLLPTGTTVQFSYTKSNTPGCTNQQLGEWAEALIAFKGAAASVVSGGKAIVF